MLHSKLVKNLNTRIIAYVEISFSALIILPFPNTHLEIPEAHEQLSYALKSEKIKLKTHYGEWAVNKKILNQT